MQDQSKEDAGDKVIPLDAIIYRLINQAEAALDNDQPQKAYTLIQRANLFYDRYKLDAKIETRITKANLACLAYFSNPPPDNAA